MPRQNLNSLTRLKGVWPFQMFLCSREDKINSRVPMDGRDCTGNLRVQTRRGSAWRRAAVKTIDVRFGNPLRQDYVFGFARAAEAERDRAIHRAWQIDLSAELRRVPRGERRWQR